MPYSTLSDILEQVDETTLTQITDDAGEGAVDEGVVERAVADADAEINGYCGRRYAVPFADVPAIVRKISVEIAIYNMFARRGRVPEIRRTRYEDAVAFLRDVSKGLVSLGEDDADGTPAATHTPEIESADRIFSRESLKGW